jgi:lipopolysaccharide heptosyltransferase II
MRKILVVNMNYMGDALLTTPALAALRKAYPDAQIDTVVGAGAAADVLTGNPDLDNIIARTARGSWGRCAQLYQLLREKRYTDTIILPPLPAYAIAAFAAGTPVRVGQANRGMNRFLTHLMPTTAEHMADAMLDTVDVPADARAVRRRLTVTVERESVEFAERLLRSAGLDIEKPIVAVNLGATRPQKRWFAESFAGFIDELGDMQTVLIGAGDDDKALAGSVLSAVRGVKPASIVGKTSVKQLAGVLSLCELVVSADSGPMHLATAVGTPVVALFGSTNPAVTGPYDTVSRSIYKALSCAPCFNHPTCNGRFDCLRAITPLEVAAAVRAIIRDRRQSTVADLPMANFAPSPQDSRLPNEERAESPTSPLLRAGRHERPGVKAPDSSPSRFGRGAEERGGVGSVRQNPAGAASAQAQQASASLRNTPHREGGNAPQREGGGYKRVLIVTKFRFIGDTLLAIPIFRAARAQWPDARIVLLTGKNARMLLQNNPYLDEIIELDPYKRDSGQAAFWQLIGRLRHNRFDLCLALNRSFHSALLPWLSGVRTRAGFESEGRGALLNRRVEYDREKSEIACYFDVIKAVAPDIPVDPSLELWVSPEESAGARTRIEAALAMGDTGHENVTLVGIQPGASLDGKRWPAARFAAVADALVKSDENVRIVLVGGKEEQPVADEMIAACVPETRQRLVSFVGACDLRGSLGLISYLHLFIGNDTAVMHSAVALGVPTVALFGPTNPRKWGNYGDRHRVLESPDHSMEGIPVDNVAASARELLNIARTGAAASI